MSPVAVRLATAADLEAVLGLYAELAAGDPAREPPSLEDARSLLGAALEQAGRSVLVADGDGAVLGTADLLVVTNLSHRGAPWAIVENVVVAEAARRRGVGRALMARAVELAEDAGCYKLQLLSMKHRTDAHAFYRSLGLQPLAEGFRIYFDETTF
jgi:GNAT superfamily N-acetyltransferase